MIQALTDSHEWVVEKVLHAFTSLTRVGLFAKTTLWDLLNLVLPLLYHPNLWIRYEAVVLVVAITDQLPDVDKWCLVLPALQPFLKMDILDITPDSLQQALKPPITRRLLQEVLTKPADKVDQSSKLALMSRSSGSGGGLEGEFDHRLSLSPHSSPRLLPWPLYHANDSQDSIDLSGAAQRGDDQFRRGDSFTSGPGDITLTGDEDKRIPAQWRHLRHAEPQDIPKLEALAFYINRVRDTYRQFTALEQARQLGAITNGSSQEPVGRSTQHRTSSEGVTHPVSSQAERMNSVELRDLGLTPHTEFLTPWDAVRPLYSAAWFAAGPGLDQSTAKFSMLPMLRSESNPEYRRNSTDRQWESVSNTSISANSSTNPVEMASPAPPPSQWLSSPLVSARSPASTVSLPGLHAEISARKPSIAEKGTTVHNASLTKAQPSVALASVDPSVQLPCSRAGIAKGGDTSKQVLESLNQALHHRPPGGYRQQRSASVQYSGNRVPGHRLLHRPRFADTPMQKYRHVFSGTTGGGYFDNYIPTPGAKPDLLSRVGGEGWRELSEMMATGPDTEAAVAGRASGSAVTWTPHTTSFPLMSPTSALHWLIHYDAGQTIKRLLRKKALEVFPRSFPELGPPTNASLLTQHRRLIQEAIPSLQTWRPEGTLVAYFKEHTGAINQIALSSDHAKFATASNDGTVLVWDCTRLDKQVLHRAQASYQVGARVESITFIHNTYSMAAVGDDGSVHLIRLECSDTNYQPLCGECRLVRRCQFPPGEYAVQVEHVHSESTSYLLTATTRSRLVALDLHTLATVWALEVPPRYGLLTCFLVDPRRTWLLVGTASGVLVLWDLRFRIPVKAWQHPAQSRIYQLQMFLTALSQGRLVLVAAGRNEVSVWDVAQARCREVFCGSREWPELQDDLTHHSYQALDPPTIESALRDMIPYNTDSSTLSLGTDSGGSPGGQHDLISPLAAGTNVETAARTIVFPANSSYFLVAGTDHKIRYWDLECIEQSYIISGDTPKFMGRPRYQYTTHRVQGIAFHTESRSPTDGASSARSPLPRAVRQSQEPSATNTVPFRSSEDSGKHPLATSTLGTHSHKYHVRSSKGGGYFAHLQSVLANHEDCITAMQLTEVPYPMIISGARNGVLRLYL
ncbi:Serine/threonine-protein kinase [Dispira simplex]|nr:Serine/threonine-protein kinase [Dispira simplex]